MDKIKVNDDFNIVRDGRRIRVVDRKNGAVVVEFRVPSNAPENLGDALKQAVDAATGRAEAAKKKTSTTKKKKENETVEEAVDDGSDET